MKREEGKNAATLRSAEDGTEKKKKRYQSKVVS